MDPKTCLFITQRVLSEHAKITIYNQIYEQLCTHNIQFIILSYNEKHDFFGKKSERLKPDLLQTCIRKNTAKNLLLFISQIYSSRPDILLIGGYGHFENWFTWLWGILTRTPIVLWTGAGINTTSNNSWVYLQLKKIFLQHVKSFVTYGENSKLFLTKLGINNSKIFVGRNVSDISFFKKTLGEYYKSNEYFDIIKDKIKPTFAFVGRFEKIKGIDLFLEQLSNFPLSSYFCYFIGTGSLAPIVEKQIKQKKISGEYLGHLDRHNLAKKLIESDFLFCPSRNDPFSRIVSEGISCGCFTIASIYDDAAHELIIEGINGTILDPYDNNKFKDIIDQIIHGKIVVPDKIKISLSIKDDTQQYSNKVVDAVISVLMTE